MPIYVIGMLSHGSVWLANDKYYTCPNKQKKLDKKFTKTKITSRSFPFSRFLWNRKCKEPPMFAVLDRQGNCLALLVEKPTAEQALREGWLLGKDVIQVSDLYELQEAMFLPRIGKNIAAIFGPKR